MVRPPRGSTRSNKYIVDKAEASNGAGFGNWVMAVGTDNDSLGQTTGVDTAVPVGSKIKLLDIRIVLGNLVSINDFVYWGIQRFVSGQGSLNPTLQGGNPLRKTMMLSGLVMIGKDQNRVMHIRYKIPKRFQRMGDGDTWQLVFNFGQITTSAYQVVYKVFE